MIFAERDAPQLGPHVPAETLRRLWTIWTMLAHGQGGLLNLAELARSPAVDGKTVARYVDLLADLSSCAACRLSTPTSASASSSRPRSTCASAVIRTEVVASAQAK